MYKIRHAFILCVFFIALIPSIILSQNNSELAITMQVNTISPEGELGLGLTGSGYDKVGIWFSSATAPYNHIEFGNRLINTDGYSGSATDHETSTAGIIMAEGKNELARGMAYEATLKAFDTIDQLLEMETEAANGMEIASYSFAGANILNTAYYGYADSVFDDIAYNYHQFLLFQAAGHRQEVTGVSGQGKNIVSVGSVQTLTQPYSNPSDVIAIGNKTGPAFDSRIKPDLVAPGGASLMCKTDDGYGITGPATSYSAPAAAGVGVLLQQHYQNTHNQIPMLSSELKGLLIHTTEEAGPGLGPDAEFGWGLINAKRAANVITADIDNSEVISTQILNEGGVFERVIYSDGTQPLKVTICWIDPAGEPGRPDFFNNYYIDPSPRLINDLDIVITGEGSSFAPYRLDPRNPTGPALNFGKNYVDNVEQVYIEAPQEGYYTIAVNHDGLLTHGSQDFSMIVTGDTDGLALRQDKTDVLSTLQSLYPTNNNRVDWRLTKAINFLNWSLADALWEDDNYLTQYGAAVFNREMIAVGYLNWIIKDKYSDVIKDESLEAIISLAEIDKQLAQLLIDEAIENGGDGDKIEKAQNQMNIAQQFIMQEKYYQAINKYKWAWWYARRSLVLVGLAKESSTGEFAEAMVTEEQINDFKLDNNYPNPFNPSTVISYHVPYPTEVQIVVYNLLGVRIATLINEFSDAGSYEVKWNGTDDKGMKVGNGVYFYELKAGEYKQIKQMTLIK